MNPETQTPTYQSNQCLTKRIRQQVFELLSRFSLKGKISVNANNGPNQIEVSCRLPLTTAFQSETVDIQLTFKVDEAYPEDPPSVFLTSHLLMKKYSFIDIVSEEQWNPLCTIASIVESFVQNAQNYGVKNCLETIFSSISEIQSSYRHIREQNNIKIQGQSIFNNFFSPFSSFKPLSKTTYPLESVEKNPKTLLKYKKKDRGDLKFYQLPDKKQIQYEKLVERGKKRQAKPMNKNANLPKFLIRIFIKYVDRFKSLYVRKQYDKLQVECRKMKDWKKHDKKQHAFGLKHLKRFFQDEEDGYPPPTLNRKVITQIISQYLLEEICENSQIPQNHRVGYLTACKVYSLRCRNSSLAGRIQSK